MRARAAIAATLTAALAPLALLGLWSFSKGWYWPALLPHEWSSVIPLCAIALVMGVFPTLFLKPMEPAVTRVVERLQNTQTLRVERERVERTECFEWFER